MTITWKTLADVAPLSEEVELVVYTDKADSTFTWSAVPPTGVTFAGGDTSQRVSGTNASTKRVRVTGTGPAIQFFVQGDVSPKSAALTIKFNDYSVGGNAPLLTMSSDAEIVIPGDTNDAVHSPLYSFTLQTWDGAAYSGVKGAEVRWTISPTVAGSVYDSAGTTIDATTADATYYASKTDATGKTSVRVTAKQIVQLTVQAATQGVPKFKVEKAYYSTLDPTDPYWQDVPLLNPGPYTDNVVDLEGTTEFGIMVPGNLTRPPKLTFEQLEGFIQIGVLGGTSGHIAREWDTMAPSGEGSTPVLGRTWSASNAILSQTKSNLMQLFVQDNSSGNVFSYYPFSFTTEGSYLNQPDPTVPRQHPDWIPGVTGLPPGGVVNSAFLARNSGIPVSFTYDFPAPYDDGTWSIYFEWFLNNVDLTFTNKFESPQQVALTKIVAGSTKYTDLLKTQLASNYSGPGVLYVDFYLGKSPDTPADRVYSEWSRQGWVLST